MARARNIKPGLYKNEDLSECSIWARYIFPGLWMLADRDGRLEDRPKRIKGELLPYDSSDMNGLLDELAKFGFIHRYELGGMRYIQIMKFSEHQAPHSTEKDSVIPDVDGIVTVNERSKNGGVTGNFVRMLDGVVVDNVKKQSKNVIQPNDNALIPDSLIPDSLIPDTGYLNPESLKEKPSVELKPDPADDQTDDDETAEFEAKAKKSKKEVKPEEVKGIFEYWKEVMKSPGSKFDAARKGLIERALKMDYTARELCLAIRGCSRNPHNMGQNDRSTKYNGLDLILRNANKIDYFIQLNGSAPRASPASESVEQANARIMAEALGEAQPSDAMTIDMETK